jgi:hypothetical protein
MYGKTEFERLHLHGRRLERVTASSRPIRLGNHGNNGRQALEDRNSERSGAGEDDATGRSRG